MFISFIYLGKMIPQWNQSDNGIVLGQRPRQGPQVSWAWEAWQSSGSQALCGGEGAEGGGLHLKVLSPGESCPFAGTVAPPSHVQTHRHRDKETYRHTH